MKTRASYSQLCRPGVASARALLLAFAVAIAVALSYSCRGRHCGQTNEVDFHEPGATAADETAFPQILSGLPVNDGHMCFSITSIAESLLERDKRAHSLVHDEQDLVDAIYHRWTDGSPAHLGDFVSTEQGIVALEAPNATARVAQLLSERYESDFRTAMANVETRDRVERAQKSYLKFRGELLERLVTDRDRTMVFCGDGWRRFPDGTTKEISHAVLIRATDIGELLIWDSNAPQEVNTCHTFEEDDTLYVEWQCTYRRTGMRTRQFLAIVAGYEYYRASFGRSQR